MSGSLSLPLVTPKVKQQAGRFLGLGRSGQDRALIRFEDLEPGRDVAGVMVEVGDRQTQFCPRMAEDSSAISSSAA